MGYLLRDKNGRSPYWYAVWRCADGVQRRRTTKCTNKIAAREILRGLEAAELLGATQNATEEQFRLLVGEIAARTTGRKFADPTIRSHLETWLKGEEGTVSDSTIERYRQVSRDFVAWLGARADARLEALTKDVFLAYRDRLQRDGHSVSNINQTLKVLARPFKIAAAEQIIRHNPLGAIKRLRGQSAEKGTFAAEQIARLLTAATDDEWRALILLGYFTGGRLIDLARLTWAAWDREANTLGFKQKTGGLVVLPVHPELAQHLQRLPAGVGKASILPSLAVQSGRGRSGLSMQFRKIMDRAGIDAGIARERSGKAGHSVSKLSFHSLRHSFTSALAAAGVAPEVRQQLTGHADLKSHQGYTHPELDTFRRAIAALPALPSAS
jgi:integrase